jgi:hypothetical protein
MAEGRTARKHYEKEQEVDLAASSPFIIAISPFLMVDPHNLNTSH